MNSGSKFAPIDLIDSDDEIKVLKIPAQQQQSPKSSSKRRKLPRSDANELLNSSLGSSSSISFSTKTLSAKKNEFIEFDGFFFDNVGDPDLLEHQSLSMAPEAAASTVVKLDLKRKQSSAPSSSIIIPQIVQTSASHVHISSVSAASASSSKPAHQAASNRLTSAASSSVSKQPPPNRKPIENEVFYSVNDLLDLSLQITPDWTKVRHVLMIDLDNWPKFFTKLPGLLPRNVYVCTFWGGATVPKIQKNHQVIQALIKDKRIYFCQCGNKKNSADFALTLKVGEINSILPHNIPITIVSGDRGFEELKTHLSREIIFMNPHSIEPEILYVSLLSVTDT